MAVSSSTIWEVRTAGADTNGGGFVAGAAGVDFSQQDAANSGGNNSSTADAVAVGTGVITSVTASFTADIVGNVIYLAGGSGGLAAGYYQVTIFTSSTSITVDRNVAAGTGITMNIGGALGSIGQLGLALATGGVRAWIKSGTYSITSASTNVSGGCFTGTGPFYVEGYQTTRGDRGTKPLFQASGISTFAIWTMTGARSFICNLSADGASLTSSRGFLQRGLLVACHVANCNNGGFVVSNSHSLYRCTATGCATISPFTAFTQAVDCVAYENTVAGFSVAATCIRCISDSNSGATTDGFITTAQLATMIDCVAYGNGRDGFRLGDGPAFFENCIAESNTGIGFDNVNNSAVELMHCAAFSNTGGNTALGTGFAVTSTAFVTGTGSFFTNAAGQDFSLNATAGAGAAARAVGYPGVLPVGGTGYHDIGALQHEDAGGGDVFMVSVTNAQVMDRGGRVGY